MSEQFIDQIYEASFAPEKWPELLADLSQAVDGKGGCLFTLTRGAAAHVGSEAIAADLEEFMRDGWVTINTRTTRAEALAHPGFLTDLDLYSVSELATEPIYRDFLHPRDLGWAAGTLIPLPTGDLLAFSVERSTARGPFERAHVEALDRLRPHIVRAAVVCTRIGLDKAQAGAGALEALGLPAAVLGANGQMVACNRLMEGLIPGTIRDRTGRIQIVDRKADSLLAGALSALAFGARQGIAQSFPVADGTGRPTGVVHLLPVRGAAHDLFSQIHSILVVTPLAAPVAPPPGILQAMFDLTPSEARIASALAAGRSIDTISREFGVARETVRSHLRSIFAKSGVSKQSALVRLLLSVTLPSAADAGD